MQSDQNLKKSLSLPSLSILGIGIIIGAGVYAVLGAAAGRAGNSLWLSFIMAALIATLTAFSYCELATLYPNAGAEVIYFKNAYPEHKFLIFLLGLIVVLTGIASAATVSIGFGGYLQNFIEFPKGLAAFILLAMVTLINSLGIKSSIRTNLIFTIIEVTGLLIVVWFGWTTESNIRAGWKISSETISATSLIFFVYLGFEHIANFAEETKNPDKNIPLAFLISLFVTTILYIAVALATMRLTTPEILSQSDLPLAEAIRNTAPRWVNVLSAIALFSTANTALITMLSISRMIYGIAKEGDLPKPLAKTTGDEKNPILAGIAALVGAVGFLLWGELEILANLSSFTALLIFLVVNYTLVSLRFKKPDLKRSFKIPLNIGRLPIIPLLGFIVILALCTQFKMAIYMSVSFIVITCSIIYFITKQFR